MTRTRKTLPPNVTLKGNAWHVRKSYTVAGKTYQLWRACTDRTAAGAAAILKELEAQIAREKGGHRNPGASRFVDVADRFAAQELRPAVFQNGEKIAGRVNVRDPARYVRELKAEFAFHDITEVTFGAIKSYKAKLLATPTAYPDAKARQRSIRSVNYRLTILRQILNFAVEEGSLTRNPFSEKRGKSALINTRLENRRYVTWTREEEAAALELCVGNYRHMKAVITLITDGGFRKGELLQAKWSEVNWKDGYILARHYKGVKVSVRKIYLTKRARAALTEWRALQKTDKRIKDRSLVIGFADVKNAWRRIRAAIGRPDLRIHDLRHVFATRLYERGVHMRDIQRVLDHANISTTEIYVNPAEDRLRETFQALED